MTKMVVGSGSGVKLKMPQLAGASALQAKVNVTVPVGSAVRIGGVVIVTGTPSAQLLVLNKFVMQVMVSGVLLASVNVYVMLKAVQLKPVWFCPSKQVGTPAGHMFVAGVPVGVKAPENIKVVTGWEPPPPFRMMVGSMVCAPATPAQAKTRTTNRIVRFIDSAPSCRETRWESCTQRTKAINPWQIF